MYFFEQINEYLRSDSNKIIMPQLMPHLILVSLNLV